MLKIHSSSISSSNDAVTRIISFEHDFLIKISGRVKDTLPLFERGTTVSAIQKFLKVDAITTFDFIQLLLSLKVISNDENSGAFVLCGPGIVEFGDLGFVIIEEVPQLDTGIYAQTKAFKELPGGGEF